MNLSELHQLPDLLVVQRAVLSVVLADEVLEDTHNMESATGSFQSPGVSNSNTHWRPNAELEQSLRTT